MNAFITFVCLIFSITAFADEAELQLPVGDEVFTLYQFGEVFPRQHCFGEYRFPIQLTGGTKLHLFPNNRFVISGHSDIGPDELQAAGTFRVNEDRLTLEFSRVQPGKENLKTKFSALHILYGRIQKKNYVTGFEVFVFSSDEMEKLKAKAERPRYMQRGTEYNDWE